MNFNQPEELRMVRDSVRRFVDDELMPLERRYANVPDLPDDLRQTLQAKAKARGFWAFDLPVEYGGGGMSTLAMCAVMEELARCTVPAFRAPSVFTPFLGPVLFHGTATQKEKYLMPVIRGEKRTCFALTEAAGGSDPASMNTRAVQQGDAWVINGSRIFITGADKADFIQLFARTEGPERDGVTCFLVDKETPGCTLGQQFSLMSPDKPWELVFSNVLVPSSQIVGEVGKGWDLAREFLQNGRLLHGPRAVGRAQRALDMAISWANKRETFGVPLPDRQAIQRMLAESHVELSASRLLAYEAACRCDEGKPYHLEASMVKMHADEIMMRVVDRAMQIHGGIGFPPSYRSRSCSAMRDRASSPRARRKCSG